MYGYFFYIQVFFSKGIVANSAAGEYYESANSIWKTYEDATRFELFE